jgi:hypothetical protein
MTANEICKASLKISKNPLLIAQADTFSFLEKTRDLYHEL